MTDATEKQIDYIITLANRLHGTSAAYLSQAQLVLPTSQRQLRGGMTKAEASAHIESLLKALKERED